MQVCRRQLNLYFALAAALIMLCGCQSVGKNVSKNKQLSILRVHLEAGISAGDSTESVSVLRDEPVLVTIARTPVLAENNIAAARVADSPGGFAIQVQFDENGTWVLEQYSAANPGKHLVIFGQWGEKITDGRWLSAPLITQRIQNGILSFTPDCTREEADRLVLGLNNTAKTIRKGQLK
jgi:preprotein translocase subunit SecD